MCITAYAGQVAVWSWFPPPSAWEAARSGCNWLDWTERCEEVFLNIINNVRVGKSQPKPYASWVSHLRGQTVSRALIKFNNTYSQEFMDRVVLTGQHI